ncbi:hypothetical protein ACFWE3_06615 [Mycobacteriaceae bacterium NPDC060252]
MAETVGGGVVAPGNGTVDAGTPVASATRETGEAAKFVIRNEQDLHRLPRALVRPRAIRVQLEVSGVDPDVRQQLERRLSQLLSTCGCGEGAALGLLYLVFWPAVLLTDLLPTPSLAQWALISAGFFVTLIGGKLLGLGVARARLARQTRLLRRLLAQSRRLDGRS